VAHQKENMPLKKLPYKRLDQLIAIHLSTEEDPPTSHLMKELMPARKRGYLTTQELIKVCRWKSARAIRHIRRNRPGAIKQATQQAFCTRDEGRRLTALMELHGVRVPMASAILTLTHPARYGVIDIRVWQLLHKMGKVTTRARGAGFSPKEWEHFLIILRGLSQKYHVKARDIERTLFQIHVRYQRGVLYGGKGKE
jgi:hypothetical protein